MDTKPLRGGSSQQETTPLHLAPSQRVGLSHPASEPQPSSISRQQPQKGVLPQCVRLDSQKRCYVVPKTGTVRSEPPGTAPAAQNVNRCPARASSHSPSPASAGKLKSSLGLYRLLRNTRLGEPQSFRASMRSSPSGAINIRKRGKNPNIGTLNKSRNKTENVARQRDVLNFLSGYFAGNNNCLRTYCSKNNCILSTCSF